MDFDILLNAFPECWDTGISHYSKEYSFLYSKEETVELSPLKQQSETNIAINFISISVFYKNILKTSNKLINDITAFTPYNK